MGKPKSALPVNSFAWSRSGELVVARGSGIEIMDAKKGEAVTTLDTGVDVDNVVLGDCLVVYGDGALRVVDRTSGQTKTIAETDFARWLELSPDGSELVVVTQESDVGAKMLSTYTTSDWKRRSEPVDVGWGNVLVSTDATMGINATMNYVALFDVRTREELRRFQRVGSVPRVLAFSRNTARVAGGNADGMVQVWDTTTGKFVMSNDGKGEMIEGIDISPDGTHIITGGSEAPARLWSVASRKEVKTKGTPEDVRSLVYDPSGAFVAMLTDEALFVCDALTLKPLHTF